MAVKSDDNTKDSSTRGRCEPTVNEFPSSVAPLVRPGTADFTARGFGSGEMSSLLINHRFMIIIFTCFLVYYPSFLADFVFDDISAIVNNLDVRTNETSWYSIFLHDYWGSPIDHEASHKSYRPLTVLTFRFNFFLDQLNPFGYHFINVLLHTVVCVLFLSLSQSLIFSHHSSSKTSKLYAFVSSLIFALHPIHTEAVAGVVGRAELLSAIFFLSSLLTYHQRWYILSAFLAIVSTLSKEQGVTVIGVIIVYELSRGYSLDISLKRVSLFTCLAVVIMIFRIWIMGGTSSLPVFTRFDNPASFAAWPMKQLTYLYLIPLNLLLLLHPHKLCCDWTMQSVPLVKDIYDHRNMITFITLVIISIFSFICLTECITCWRKKLITSPLPLILSLTVFPYIPSSNLLHPVGFVLAERTLYLPSIGFILIVVYGFKYLQYHIQSKRLKIILNALLLLHLLSYAGKTFYRSYDWFNEKTLYTSGIQVNPHNAKLYNNLGHFYEKQRDWSEALKYFEIARNLQPDDLGSSINIARTHLNMGDPVKAEKILWSVKPKIRLAAKKNDQRVAPNYLSLWINLGNIISQNESRLEEAEQVYRELINMRSDFVDAYINLGGILVKQEKLLQAIDVYKLALNFASKTSDLYYNLAVVQSLIMQENENIKDDTLSDKINEIAHNFLKAMESSPNKDALINLAIMVQKYPQMMKENKYLVKRLLKEYTGPEKERMWFNLALIHSDEGDNLQAEHCLRKAIEIRPDFTSALFNLAVILNETDRLFEAEIYLTKLLSYNSQHKKSHLLLTEIFLKFNQTDKAERVSIISISFFSLN